MGLTVTNISIRERRLNLLEDDTVMECWWRQVAVVTDVISREGAWSSACE